jgi:hypothetical protein
MQAVGQTQLPHNCPDARIDSVFLGGSKLNVSGQGFVCEGYDSWQPMRTPA